MFEIRQICKRKIKRYNSEADPTRKNFVIFEAFSMSFNKKIQISIDQK